MTRQDKTPIGRRRFLGTSTRICEVSAFRAEYVIERRPRYGNSTRGTPRGRITLFTASGPRQALPGRHWNVSETGRWTTSGACAGCGNTSETSAAEAASVNSTEAARCHDSTIAPFPVAHGCSHARERQETRAQ
jgi:hypothetical protein